MFDWSSIILFRRCITKPLWCLFTIVIRFRTSSNHYCLVSCLKKIIYPATMLFCSFDETFHALLSCFFRSRYVLRSFLFINILSRNIILERILRTLAVRFQAPRLETIQVSDAIVGRTEKLESSIFACLCIAPFSWFLCRSLAEHVESCHGWIYYPIHHSVSVGLPRGAIVNKETIQTSQLVPYNG